MALVTRRMEHAPRTSDIEFFSSLHGRQKRLERGLNKRDLQGEVARWLYVDVCECRGYSTAVMLSGVVHKNTQLPRCCYRRASDKYVRGRAFALALSRLHLWFELAEIRPFFLRTAVKSQALTQVAT